MSDLTTKVLIEIRDEMKATRGELREGLGELRAVAERHEEALGKLVVGVNSLNTRFDNFLTGVHKPDERPLTL